MKNVMNGKIWLTAAAWLSLLCGNAVRAGSPEHQLWRLGVPDGSGGEFALWDRPYADYAERYASGTITFEPGRDDSGKVPYFIPGPADAWAGNRSHALVVRFALQSVPEGACARLALNLLETHPSLPPRLEIALNGYVVEVQTPTGANQDYFDDRNTSSRALRAVAEFPAGALSSGDNHLMIRTTSGSWLALDDAELTADAPARLEKPRQEVGVLFVSALPALVYGKERALEQPVRLRIMNWGKARTVAWTCEGRPCGSFRLNPGLNEVEAGVPESFGGRTVSIGVAEGGQQAASVKAVLPPVDKWTVYLVQHTHTDIGYTKPQTEILTEHLRYIDYAIEYCERTEDYPDDARFRWTCEAAWAVREWLRVRPEEQIGKFLRYVREGRIEVTAMFFNMSELSGEGNYKAFLEPLREFRERGIPVVTAMQNDVNGVAWCLADYLPDLGVKYLTVGSNSHRALIPFDRPTVYRWESPSGKSLVAFRADHYNTANFWGIDRGDTAGVENGVFSYIRQLKERNYPFPCVAVQYSGYFTDNSPPSMQECDLIRAWNEKYAWPKLRSALAREFPDAVSEAYADSLPVYRAAYPDWWTDGFGSAARETAASRSTQADMQTIEGLLSMAVLNGTRLPDGTREELSRIRERLLFYDEHTFGAAESIRDPLCENGQVQWAEKGAYVWEGLKSARMLYETSAGLLQGDLYRSGRPTVTFFNPLAWKRSELAEVYIDYELVPKDRAFRLVDESGRSLPVQAARSRSEGRYYAVYAEDIPAVGYKTFEIVLDEGEVPEEKPVELENAGYVLENDFYRLTFDPQRGTVASLWDKQLGRELADREEPWQLGGFVYESLKGDRRQMERYRFEQYERFGLSDVQLVSARSGAIWQSVRFRGVSRGCDTVAGVTVELRLYHHTKRIEWVFDARRLPESDPSGLYVAFPFSLEGAELAFEVPGGVLRSGDNQLPNTASGWNTVQNFVSVRNDSAQLVMGCDAVPLFLMGELLTDPYRQPKRYEKPHVYSWVMNNYWTTNFRAYQEGELKWRYYLTSSEDVSGHAAARFGWGNRIPLYARVIPAGKENGKVREKSFFSIPSDHLLMTSCQPSVHDGCVWLNVRETDGKAAELTVLDGTGKPLKFERTDALDAASAPAAESLRLKPYENVFIRLRL